MRRLMQPILLTIAALVLQTEAIAELESATLAKIKQSGTISLGVRESSVPFSFVEPGQKQAIGYSIDICEKIVESIRKNLKNPKLDVKQVVVTPSDRIPKLLDGTIDLECGSTTNTRSRQEQVAFSYTTFMTGTRFVVKKSSKVASVEALNGKVVVSTAGTNNEKVVTKANYDRSWGFVMKSAKDHAEAFAQVKSGAAAAFAMDDVLLAGLISQSGAPDEYEMIGNYLSIEPYGLMLRKGDPQFTNLVDATVVDLFHKGEITKIYNKWFLTKTLHFPIPRLMREAILSPTKEPAWP